MSATVRAALDRWRMPVPWLDVAMALLLVGYAVASTAQDPLARHPVAEVVAGVMAGSVVLRTRAPLAMAVVAAAGALLGALLPNAATPLWTFLTILLVCFSAGANLAGRKRWAALGLLLASGYALQLASVDRNEPSDNTFTEVFVSPLVIVGGPAFAGGLLRRSRAQTAELRRLTSDLAAERARHAELAAAAERNRIARELHDVVSHAVTVMVVQAGAAEQLLERDHEARGPVTEVRETGKQALAELRRQLGLMRAGDQHSASPLPGLAQIPDLVAASGASFTGGEPDVEEVAAGVGLTAYRVVQESLTNAHRYASGGLVDVHVSGSDGDLEIVVMDTGRSAGSAAAAPAGAGVGLQGMRERVELYGGCLEAGPVDGGRGWRVRARLPLPGPRGTT